MTTTHSKAKKFAIGAVVAAAAGYVAGLLTAPKSGKETREDIKQTAGKVADDTEAKLKELYGELEELIVKVKANSNNLSAEAKEQIEKVMNTASSAKQKAAEILKAVDSGKSKDDDLGNAIKEATNAIKHLKSYLDK
jgi:gas vesicle protein